MDHRRHQAVHHELRHTDHPFRHGHGGHRHPREPQGDLHHHRAERHPGLHSGGAVRQGRLARIRHASADVRRRQGPDGEPARCRGSRIPQLPQHPRRRPHRDRGAVHRCCGRVPGSCGRVCEEPHRVRQRSEHEAERAVHPGADARASAHGSSRVASRRAAPRCGRALRRGISDRQTRRRRRRDGQRQGRDADLRRQRVHERVPGRPSLPRLEDPRDRRGDH